MSAFELYQSAVRSLPLQERLQLASMILNDAVADPTDDLPGYSDEWTDEELRLATAASMARGYAADDEPDDLADYDGVGDAEAR